MICNMCIKQDVCILKDQTEIRETFMSMVKEICPEKYKEVECSHRVKGDSEQIQRMTENS